MIRFQQALLYIVFGIGLDDAFIIFSSYARTDPSLSPVDRIRKTMKDVGISIFMTTATTEVAFVMGLISPLPAIRWLCVSCRFVLWYTRCLRQ